MKATTGTTAFNRRCNIETNAKRKEFTRRGREASTRVKRDYWLRRANSLRT